VNIQGWKNKPVIVVLLYWAIFIIIPGCVMVVYRNSKDFDLSGYIALYILFIAPLLFAAPYLIVRNNLTGINKIYFVIFGLVIPYIIIYSLLYYQLTIVGPPRF